MVKEQAMASRIDKMWHCIKQIEEILQMPLATFLTKKYVPLFTERCVQIIIEAMTDLGNYIIRKEGLTPAESYADIFRILCRNKILDITLEDELVSLAKLRNVIVHLYVEVDSELLYQLLTEGMDIIKETAKQLVNKIEEIDNR
ncbi:MAG: DUF86 domain-containing protein [Candidatus Heimdallarchaeota archaeon]|nr:DUF86 domain-containing protein [Candidatus Heimdallarchaeota archaeon]